jgi:uncharacterized protein (TIGR03545 family)
VKEQERKTEQSKDRAEKAGKPPKAPGPFRKPLPQKVFEKRFIKFIEHPGDRQFFVSCFDLREDRYMLREGLERGDIKKLKALLKVIKTNRKGPVKLVPLVFALAVITALAVFFTVFMNPLLERAIERGMEALFEARVDVDHFNLNLLRFRVGLDGITVANRDSPMKNLFQTGRMEFRLKPEAVLQGKVYIEEIRTDAIRFGTGRTVSGALPDRPPKVKKPKPPKPEMPPLVNLQNFDAMGLLNREYDKLNTPKVYDAAINAYNESLEKWKGQVELVQTRGNELRASAQPLLRLNVNDMRDIETITKTIQDITTLVNTVQTATDDAKNLVDSLETDINTALGLERMARTSITGDLNHLKSYLDFGSGTAFSALEPSIREILSDTAEQYLDYGIRALEVFEKLKAMSDARPKPEPKPKKTPKVAFKGRDVVFPSRAYPKFYLGILASDFTLNDWNWGLDLRGVSSDPDLSGVPVNLALSLSETSGALSREAAFKGSADFRTAAAERFSAEVSGRGFPVSLENQLKQAGIGGFNGDVAFAVGFSGRTDGGVVGNGNVEISKARLVDPEGTLAQAVDTAVREAGEVRLGISYEHFAGQDDTFAISTNIGDLILNALKRTAEIYAKKAADELERVLREKIAQYIDGRFVSRDELDLLFKTARGDKAALDQLKGTLDNKKNEFEQKIRAAANEAVDQAKREAQRQAEQAVQDALQGKTPQAPSVPSLPSLPGGIRLPGR